MKRMKHQKQSFGFSLGCALVVSLHVHALNLTWDTTTGDGATITAGSGNWNTTGGNLVWNDGANNVVWTQISTTVATNNAIFGGADGAVDSYVVTLGSQMAVSNLTFNSTGYKITNSTIYIGGAITVAADKTVTINSLLNSANAGRGVALNAGSVLNLSGGFSGGQYQFTGAGTLNITGGASSPSVPQFKNAVINQTGGTVNFTGSAAQGNWINYAANRNVNYTVSGSGTMNLAGTGAGAYLAIGRNNGAYTATLTVEDGGTVNIGTNTTGQISIPSDGNGNGKLDVQGGTLTVGTGNITNQIYLFPAGIINATYSAVVQQSGGTVTAQGIQFGDSGTYASGASAKLQLTGGNLYIGRRGITRVALATNQVTVQLSGGMVGATTNWSSSLTINLGSSGGPVTFKTADAANRPWDIILSGALTNSQGFTKTGTGTLTLAGTNTYSGVTMINAGTLQIGDGGTSGQLGTGNVTNNASLVFNRSDDIIADKLVDGTGSVTKLGAGTLTLATGTRYTGNTVVSNGTLVVRESFLADGADVYVSTGAVLKLNFSGIDTIRSLTIGGVLQERSRRYGSSDSSGCFTGSSGFIRPLEGTPPSGTVMLLR